MRSSLKHLDYGRASAELLASNGFDVSGDGADGWLWQFGKLRVIASWGMGWDHVSVSHRDRIPLWEEMCWVKDQFFEAEETVMQLHPPHSEYVNNHSRCLHLWRPQADPVPRPPSMMVGDKRLGVIA